MPASIVLSTRNAHKLREFERLLAPYGIAVEPLSDAVELPPETGVTFAENALVKARAAAAAIGRPAIADDSGIESDALGGAPGVRSGRFAGETATDGENLAKLLAEAPEGSGLRYVCALAYVEPGGAERLFEGDCRGRLAGRPRGEGGFGYDPAFVPAADPAVAGGRAPERTMAELSDGEKDAISHRGHAVRAFARWLTETGGDA
jgi:XTP/dITP diphosphohydrolase